MKKLLVLAAIVTSVVGCTNNFKQGDNGTLYSIIEHKSNSPLIKVGDIISMNNIIKTEGDSVLISTYDAGRVSNFIVSKPQFNGDFMSSLCLLSEGDSAVIKINADTVEKKSGQPKAPGFKGKYYVYTVRIEKVFSQPTTETDYAFEKRMQTYFKSLNDKYKADESVQIKNYIANNKLAVTTTASGLNYIITTKGNGAKPRVGDTAVVNYTGKFVNGKVFETSLEDVAKKANKFSPWYSYKPAKITVGVNNVIAGWDEGLQLLSKGTKATFIIPSNLGYGEQGKQGLISPFTPLVFDIELIDVIHPKSTR
jgi:FKBP-type peptidyl-prolyl cis-trans isomerase FkpA